MAKRPLQTLTGEAREVAFSGEANGRRRGVVNRMDVTVALDAGGVEKFQFTDMPVAVRTGDKLVIVARALGKGHDPVFLANLATGQRAEAAGFETVVRPTTIPPVWRALAGAVLVAAGFIGVSQALRPEGANFFAGIVAGIAAALALWAVLAIYDLATLPARRKKAAIALRTTINDMLKALENPTAPIVIAPPDKR